MYFYRFLLILNFSACGSKSETSATENIAKVNPEVPEYVYGKYKSHVDFNSFENYASMVGVMGADVLLGKFESGDYSSNETAELSLETKKAAPEYTYYPCLDSKKVPQSRVTITHLMSDGRFTRQKSGSVLSPVVLKYSDHWHGKLLMQFPLIKIRTAILTASVYHYIKCLRNTIICPILFRGTLL